MAKNFTDTQAALAFLKTAGIPWFDDNPTAWERWTDLSDTDPGPWDLVTVANYGPFLCERIHGGYATRLDVKESIGQSYSQLFNNGQKNSPIDLTLWLPTPIDLANAVLAFRQVIANANALHATTINHPSLQAWGLTQVYLYRAGLIEKPNDGAPASVTFEFRQFFIQNLGAGALKGGANTVPNSPALPTIFDSTSLNLSAPTGPPPLVDPASAAPPLALPA